MNLDKDPKTASLERSLCEGQKRMKASQAEITIKKKKSFQSEGSASTEALGQSKSGMCEE